MKSPANNPRMRGALLSLCIVLVSCQTGRPVKRSSDDSIMYGMIYDYTSNPVSGVAVFLNSRKMVDSDIQGRFILNGVKKGAHTIKLVKKGYEELEELFQYEPLDVLYFKMSDTAQLVARAEMAMDDKHYAAAGQFIDRALKLEPRRQDILFLKAVNRYLQNDHEAARAILEELIKDGMADDAVTRLLSLIAVRAGN
jgi:tetratricopeptide (TPR) repeat protein